MNITTLYALFMNSTGVTTDSRNCPAGSIFFALKGESFNGNAFAAQALEKGSAYAVIDEAEYAVEGDERYLLVDNGLTALQQLANHHRKQFEVKVIGITGTNGKTTTKELIAAVLSTQYKVLYTQGNLNNHIGVPLTLLGLKPEHEVAVIEMGANHPGEIKLLTDIVEPDYGLITNVGKAHLEGFGSFEGVIRTKGELYDFFRLRGYGKVFVHHENSFLAEISSGLDLVSYGTTNGLYVSGNTLASSPYLTLTWQAGNTQTVHEVRTQLIGTYNLTNVLAAIAIGHHLDVPAQKINEAISAYTPRNNRSQLVQTGANTLIVDAYNANPTSMRAALENFSAMDVPHKMLIIGDMKELGPDSLFEHQEIVELLQQYHFSDVLLVGEMFAQTTHRYASYGNVESLANYLLQHKPEGKTILIKGSNSVKLSKVVELL